MKHLFGLIAGILYGGIGFGLGSVYLFCASVKTIWCNVSPMLSIFYPPGAIGARIALHLASNFPLIVVLSVSAAVMALLFGLIGYTIESAVCGLISRPRRI